MGGVYRNAAGQERYVDDADIKQALAEGYSPTGETSFTAPTGEVRTLSPEQVQAAFGESRVAPDYSYTPDAQLGEILRQRNLEDVHGGTAGTIGAGVEGVLSGVTLGGSDLLFDAMGLDTAERAEANPTARVVGEVGGSLATVFAGGSGALGKALAFTPGGQVVRGAQALGKGMGGGLKGKMAAEAAEGLAFGVGQGISNIALSNVELSAEAVGEELLKNGLFGAGLGAVAGAAGHGLGKMADKMKTAREAAEAADNAPLAAGLTPDDTKVFTENFTGGLKQAQEAADEIAQVSGSAISAKDLIYSARMSREIALDAKATLAMSGKMDAEAAKLLRQVEAAERGLSDLYGNKGLFDRSGLFDVGGQAGLNAVPETWQAAAKHLASWREAAEALSKKAGFTRPTTAARFVQETDEQLMSRAATAGDAADAVLADPDLYSSKLLRKVEAAQEALLAAGDPGAIKKATDKLEEALEAATANTQAPYRAVTSGGHVEMLGADATEAMLAKDPHKRILSYANSGPGTAGRAVSDAYAEVQARKTAFESILGPSVKHKGITKRFLELEGDQALQAAQAYAQYVGSLNKFVKGFDNGTAGAKLEAGMVQLDDAMRVLKSNPEFASTSGAELLAGVLGISEIPDIEGPADEMLKLWIGARVLRGKPLVPKGPKKDKLLSFMHSAARMSGNRAGAQMVRDFLPQTGNRIADKVVQGFGAAGGSFVANKIVDLISGGSGFARATGAVVSRMARATERLAKAGSKGSRAVAPTTLALLNAYSFGDDDKPAKTIHEAYRKRLDELAKIAANPQATQQRLNEALAPVRQVNMLLGDRAEVQAMEDARFLFEKAPKDPGGHNVLGLSKWRASEDDIVRWGSYFRGMDPAGVWERVVNGRVTPQEAEFLRARRPESFAEIQRQIAQNLPEIQKNATYDQRVRLSILFDVPVDPLTSKQTQQFIQQRFAEQVAEDQQPVDLNAGAFAENQPTETQALQNRIA